MEVVIEPKKLGAEALLLGQSRVPMRPTESNDSTQHALMSSATFTYFLEKLSSSLPLLFVIASVTSGKLVVAPKDKKGLAKTVALALATKPVHNVLDELVERLEKISNEGNPQGDGWRFKDLLKLFLKGASSIAFYTMGVQKALKETSMKELSQKEIQTSINLYYAYILLDTLLERSSQKFKPSIVNFMRTILMSFKRMLSQAPRQERPNVTAAADK